MHKKEKKKKGPAEPEKLEEEEDKLETFFCRLHDFHNPAPVAPACVPADLPPRFATNFVLAASLVASPVIPVGSVDQSAISYVNLALPSVVNPVSSPSSCIGSTQ